LCLRRAAGQFHRVHRVRRLLAGGLVAALSILAACDPGDPPPGRGAFLHGANGIAFDALDRLYVASAAADEIAAVDPTAGEPLETLTPRLGVRTPDDLAFGPDGSYWTALETGEGA
jgi:sugar lactone lactonase YvrE